jgi:GNAT superfamily N-acetyltransferase
MDTRKWIAEDEITASLDFGLARGVEDFDGAFRLLHDRYVAEGFMAPHPSGRRLGIYNALPSTKLFVARAEGRVVGTIALVQDSSLGLPIDQVYREELAPIRARGRLVGEASTLTVDPAYRGAGFAILMRLYRMLIVYAASIARLNDVCMIIAPHHGRFYRTYFGVHQFGPPRPYPRVNGLRAIGLIGDLDESRAFIRQAQDGRPVPSPYDFIGGSPYYEQVIAQLRRELPASTMTADQVAYFFSGYGPESATALGLAAGLLSAVERGAVRAPAVLTA